MKWKEEKKQAKYKNKEVHNFRLKRYKWKHISFNLI